MSEDGKVTGGARRRAPFYAAVESCLRRRGMGLESLCPPGNRLARRILEEYGAMFVASTAVRLPRVCVFGDEEEVERFQREAGVGSERFGGVTIELQPAALAALVAARREAEAVGLSLTPRCGAEAARRSFDDTVRLWRSRCDPALDHWCARGRLTAERAEQLRALSLGEQVAEVLELEREGIFFSRDFKKSILYSVAAPGASQHLSMLAFDAEEFGDPAVRRVLARHGWFQTVRSDLPHFTFLGLPEAELPARGLKKVEADGQAFWIPDIGNDE